MIWRTGLWSRVLHNYVVDIGVLIFEKKTYSKNFGSVNDGLLKLAPILTIKQRQSFGTYNKNINGDRYMHKYIHKIDDIC